MTANQGKITIALLGKTGHGKSATGNTILKKMCFKESSHLISCSKLVKDGENKIDGNFVTVYDTPGLYDTGDNTASVKNKAVKHCDILMEACQNSGVNAFILVLNVCSPFTGEEIETVNIYETIFGSDFLKTHGILVFTKGDKLSEEEEIGDFKMFLENQQPEMKRFVEKFKDNIVLIANRGAFDDIRGQHGNELLQLCINKGRECLSVQNV